MTTGVGCAGCISEHNGYRETIIKRPSTARPLICNEEVKLCWLAFGLHGELGRCPANAGALAVLWGTVATRNCKSPIFLRAGGNGAIVASSGREGGEHSLDPGWNVRVTMNRSRTRPSVATGSCILRVARIPINLCRPGFGCIFSPLRIQTFDPRVLYALTHKPAKSCIRARPDQIFPITSPGLSVGQRPAFDNRHLRQHPLTLRFDKTTN